MSNTLACYQELRIIDVIKCLARKRRIIHNARRRGPTLNTRVTLPGVMLYLLVGRSSDCQSVSSNDEWKLARLLECRTLSSRILKDKMKQSQREDLIHVDIVV